MDDQGGTTDEDVRDHGETMDGDIRDQITREDILEAIASLDRGEPHAFGASTFYDLLEGERRYPPKAVVGLFSPRRFVDAS